MSLYAFSDNQINQMNITPAVSTLQHLLRVKSITPNDGGLLKWLSLQLESLGFEAIWLNKNDVKNIILKRVFGEGPTFAFSGHVDVVPANQQGWRVDPFSGDVLNGEIYGRGAADMKGSIAAMLCATEVLINQQTPVKGTFYWLLTSDEEGEAEYGSKIIAEYLIEQNIKIDHCLVGEPTCENFIGDTIKNGRRGALSGRIKVKGKAGHVAYPNEALNAAHIAGDIITTLKEMPWWKDEPGSRTTLQVTGISVPNIVDNLVPAECEITFNVRYSHGYQSTDIKAYLLGTLNQHHDHLCVTWERPCEPYYTYNVCENDFISDIEKSIYDITGSYPKLSTAGGTSDGRFFANEYTQVIELGLKNKTIHQVNERVPLEDLASLEAIYTNLLTRTFAE